MSSLMEKRKFPGLEARSKMFLRSNSFQKLCALAQPMRLKGFKSNKEALKSVFESLIVTTRGVIQSVTYRILCFLFLTPFSKLVREPLAAVEKDGRFQTVRLFLKLTLSMIISDDKTAVKCDNGRFDCSINDEPVVSRLVDCVDAGVQTDPESSDSEEPSLEQFFDCKEDTPPSAVPAKPPTDELLHRLLERSPSCSQPDTLPTQSSQLPLKLTVYACMLGCFVQLSALVYLLNVATSIPPGLVFLILSVIYIGYVMMRITFNQCLPLKQGTEPGHVKASTTATATATTVHPVKPPCKESTTKAKEIHPILGAVRKQVASLLQCKKRLLMAPTSNGSRMSRCDMAPRSRSRPSARMMLSAEDKTISKIKLF